MAHAIGPAALVLAAVLLTACAAAPTPPPDALGGLRAEWYYPPGPSTTIQTADGRRQRDHTTAEIGGAWTVTIGNPPTTIAVQRLPDGRPATERIAEPTRNETAVFDPPLALVPPPGATAPAVQTASVALYEGLTVPPGARPTRTGQATRSFIAAEPATWTFNGRTYPAQRMIHELLLSFGPAKVRQRYDSMAVQGLGIVKETMRERVTFLGVRVSGRERTTEVVEFIDGP